MKRTAQLFLFTLLLSIILPACKEDVHMDWKLQNEQWLKQLIIENEHDSTFHVTSSGLCYKVLYSGWYKNHKPSVNSYIFATYTGKLIDGSTFDSGTNAYLGQVGGLVSGFQEGLKKMYDGANFILYIPSTLGYDTISTNTEIPPYSTLIFNVTLDRSY